MSLPELDDIEKAAILDRMILLDNHKGKVAESLGISMKSLYNKLNRYWTREPSLFAKGGKSKFDVAPGRQAEGAR